MEIVVTGIGLLTALGLRESTWKHLLAGQTAIRHSQPYAELPTKPLALIRETPIALETLTQAVIQAALEDAGLAPPLVDCGVVIGSSRGNQAKWEQLAQAFWTATQEISQPPQEQLQNWLNTFPNTAAVQAARIIQTQAPVLSPMAACATGIWSIAQAVELIHTGQCDRVLAGAVEAPITPLTLAGFERMGALAPSGAFPFDCDREGMVLGEGGAVLVLETAELAQQRQARVYGQILGAGLSADGFHVSAPEIGSRAAIAAVKQCLNHSGLTATDIDFIHTHGTATQLNDRNEAYLIQHLLPDAAVLATKGATGHTIGASGALGVAFSLLALQQQLLPPCVGLRHPAFELDFVRTTRPTPVNAGLCLSFGFGGQNGAIALARY